MKKRIWIIVISVLLAIGITLGIIFGVKSCNNEEPKGRAGDVAQMLILEENEEVRVGKPVVFNFYLYTDKDIKSITYSLNNGIDTAMSDVESGLAKNHKHYNNEQAKYFIDTGVQTIDTTDMATGYYTLVFYGITADGARHQLCSEPYIFKLVAASSVGA